MARVLLFHHALGLTDGVRAFADSLRAAGHAVDTPDLFGGRTFPTIQAGVDHADELGFDNIVAAGTTHAQGLAEPTVVAGFSLGSLPAQAIAHTHPMAAGLVLIHGGDVPADTFGEVWPASVPVQVHASQRDPWCALDEVEAFVAAVGADLHTYPGDAHLFTDSSFHEHDAAAAGLVLERTLAFLAKP